MDSTAFAMCMDREIPIIVFNFFEHGSLRRVVLGEPVGSLVTSEKALSSDEASGSE